jgi:hypothetical protein
MSGLLKNNLNNKFVMLSGVQDTINEQQITMKEFTSSNTLQHFPRQTYGSSYQQKNLMFSKLVPILNSQIRIEMK